MSTRSGAGDLRLDGETRARIAESARRARATGRTHWLAKTGTPGREGLARGALACHAALAGRDRFLWEHGPSGDFVVACGVAAEVESAGPDRYRDVRAATQEITQRIGWLGGPVAKTFPHFVGGFGFASESAASAHWKAFPAARFWLPETVLARRGDESIAVTFVRVEPGATAKAIEADLAKRLDRLGRAFTGDLRRDVWRGDSRDDDEALAAEGDWPAGPEYRVRGDRSHAVFRGQVARALLEFEDGSLEKVVLARALAVDHDQAIDVVGFLGRLRAIYPTCTLVAVGRGDDTFLAATPELLVRVEGRRVESVALAGSAPRGRNPKEDRGFAEQLRSSAKEQREHAHVVHAIARVLDDACEAPAISKGPVLRPLFGIQHLETKLSGRLASSDVDGARDVLSLVEALHPTPAVGGVPTRGACEWLARCEGLDRGWYAAPVGWLDAAGGGDFHVALRSALIRNGLADPGVSGASRALLFAGAGIVAGSDPEQELRETRIKLRALLAPLTEI